MFWLHEDDVNIWNAIRVGVRATSFPMRSFKIQAKLFQPVQTWVGMIGWCVKYEGRRNYEMVRHPRVLDQDIERGKTYLAVFRAYHTKNKLTITHDNLFKFAYAHWTTTMRPIYACFLDMLVTVVHICQLWLYI